MMQPEPRLARLRASFSDQVPALIVSSAANIRYLMGQPTLFDDDFGGLLLVSGTDSWLLVDGRYSAQAEAAGLPGRVVEWSGSIWRSLADVAAQAQITRAGYEAAQITVAQWHKIKEVLKMELAPADGLVEKLRIIKDSDEIDALTRAARLGDQVFSRIVEKIKPGLREMDVAAEIDYALRCAGAQASSFSTIVASGPNSAFPHAGAGERRLEAGDLVKMDFGGVYKGFHADMTRTIVLGMATDEQRDLYAAVAEGQSRVLDGLAPGVSGKDADALARDYFKSIGKGANFGHNLGHGVGLDVHEAPSLGPKSSLELTSGMVFTVEPGLYIPGFGGVRIEDMVVMCEHGIQILTGSTKELLEI